VVPGSVWDGGRYTLGHCPAVVSGLVPAMVSGRSLRLTHEVRSWWSIAPYAVLARVGEDFDVITVPLAAVEDALRRGEKSVWSCPIVIAGGSAHLLVAPSGLVPVTVFVALPPTLVEGEVSRWLVTPAEVAFRLGDAASVQAAFGVGG
jgi:hypothetical protein